MDIQSIEPALAKLARTYSNIAVHRAPKPVQKRGRKGNARSGYLVKIRFRRLGSGWSDASGEAPPTEVKAINVDKLQDVVERATAAIAALDADAGPQQAPGARGAGASDGADGTADEGRATATAAEATTTTELVACGCTRCEVRHPRAAPHRTAPHARPR